MASRSVKYGPGGGSSDVMVTPDSASLRITDTDTYILAGWVAPPTSADNVTGTVMVKGGTSNTNTSYALQIILTGSNIYKVRFIARDSSSTVAQIDSATTNFPRNVGMFIRAWIDVGAGTINLKVNNLTTDSASITLTSFSDPGQALHGFQRPTGVEFTRANMDEFFFCKNPPSLSAALSLIQTNIYNGGAGTQYIGLSAANKATLGLVSWWGFDETGAGGSGVSRLDLNGSGNNFTTTGDVTDDAPLVSAIYFSMDLVEAITPAEVKLASSGKALADTFTLSDTRAMSFTRAALTESISSSDDFEVFPNLSLIETMFLQDSLHTSPLLSTLSEEVSLSAWLTLKFNPPVSTWTN